MTVETVGRQNPSRVYVYNTPGGVFMARIKNVKTWYDKKDLVAIFKITYHAKR